jgi:hypothetical protein
LHNESCYQDKVYGDTLIQTNKFGTIHDTAGKIKNKSKFNSGKSVVVKKRNKNFDTTPKIKECSPDVHYHHKQ